MKEVYIGSIIRKRRQELGLTQEQLCRGICETVTLSRIENGKQTPSRSKLNALLQRLGMPGERYYALLSEQEMKISNLQTEIVSCNVLGQREQGLKKLDELERMMEADDHLTRQFVLRCRALLGRWEDGKLVPYSFREKQMLLFRAISLTVPHFCVQDISGNLYGVDELKIINQIALVYADYGQTKAAVSLYSQLLQYLDGHLQSLEQTRPMKILISYNYARVLCMEQQNEQAIQVGPTGHRMFGAVGSFQLHGRAAVCHRAVVAPAAPRRGKQALFLPVLLLLLLDAGQQKCTADEGEH